MKVEIEVPDEAPRGQHGVYVLLNGDREVVYIGRTLDLLQRLRAHRHRPWWPSVRDLEWTACADGVEARQVERRMIETFTPEGNQNDRLPIKSGRLTLPADAVAVLTDLHAAACAAGYRETAENHTLRAYVKALRVAGWTLTSIGYPINVTREYVRLMCAADSASAAHVPNAPAVPIRIKPPTKRELMPHLSVEVVEWLRTLHAEARTVNGGTAADDPRRVASEALTELIADEYLRGVTVAEIARAIGVTTPAVRFRLARHGYVDPVPSMQDKRYIGHPTIHRAPADRCRRDHDLTGDNLRVTVPGGVRICRACERIRSANYYARQREQAIA